MEKIDFKTGTFYLGDCFEVMATLPAGSVDMCVTSPPYDNLRDYNGMPAFTMDVFKPIARLMSECIKDGGVIVWNVADATLNGSETGNSFRQALYFKDECGLNIHDTMIWNKQCFSAVGALKTRYAPVFEYMFVFSKGKISIFNPIKDKPNKWAGTKNHGTVRVDGEIRRPVSNSKEIADFGQRYNVWDVFPQRQKGDGKHPAPFPVDIPRDHIVSWSNPGQTVLDPFAGSGTTAIAAIQSGRRWICVERDQTYFEKAIARVWEAEAKLVA